jgi:uncharacterized membrane protein YwaF
LAQESFWIIRPFNGVYLAAFAFFILLLALAGLLLRGRSEALRRRVLAGACLVTLAGFFVYKYFLSIDSDFSVLTSAMGGFNWWGELPLQLCNINMILIPVAVLRKSRPLMSFGFFLGPLGALMALIMPSTGFEGYSLLLPRMLGYYGTHFMIFTEGLALAVLGLYRPRFRDLPKTVLCAVGITFVIFWFNMLLRHTGLHPKANYFFAVETEGNPLLELFFRFIPFPFLYLLPSTLIIALYSSLITLGFSLADRAKAKTREKAPAD